MQLIRLIPIGRVAPDLLSELSPEIERRFPGRGAQVSAEALPHPSYAHVRERGQYSSEPILRQVLGHSGGAERALGVVDLDLFAEGLNFIFGQAQSGGTAALIALARLHPNPEDHGLLQERALKEAVHELGHTYGLRHCPDPECVMYFSNTLADTDRKSDRFCSVDEARLRAALGA